MDPTDTQLLDLPALSHHFVTAEHVTKHAVVREATQAVAVCEHLSHGEATGPATKKVIPDTGRSPDGELRIGIAGPTFVKVAI